MNPLVKNVLSGIKQEEYIEKEVAIKSEATFLTNEDRKELYASYDGLDVEQRVPHTHRKAPIAYCAPIFRNILDIHLISTLSSDPELKYITSGAQKRFYPAPGACIEYQANRAFSE